MRIIDKIEKIGTEKVKSELKELNLPDESIEKIIAFITYSLTQDYSDLLDILVHPEFRGQGIAQELMRKYLAEIKGKTQKSLLEVRQSNEKAISLYNKFGYNTISTRKKYYEDGENALIMQKEF